MWQACAAKNAFAAVQFSKQWPTTWAWVRGSTSSADHKASIAADTGAKRHLQVGISMPVPALQPACSATLHTYAAATAAAAAAAVVWWHLCSVHKSEIDVAELRLLYRKVCAAHSMQGSPIKQSFFQHWQQLSGAQSAPNASATVHPGCAELLQLR
jgi:hypothetical protein